jgi:ethanolamine utilization protein EutA
MHDEDFEHEHELMSDADFEAVARAIREQEVLELRTVGIDIGSSTSHLLFASVKLERQSQGLSSRFVVVERRVVWRSPIMLTPFLPDGMIDAKKLEHFIHHAYEDAGFRRSDIDSGAVILTGEAIKKKNARAIDEIFAKESGKFVCATAGHKLECILAAHGSGATALSRRRGGVGLHVDIGGGTTKLALINKGEILSVAAFAVGGRLLAQDSTDAWTRIDDSAHLVAKELGIAATPASFAESSNRDAVAARLATLLVDQMVGGASDALGRSLELTEPLLRDPKPDFISFSGGVGEYIFGHENRTHGDIAKNLADNVVSQLKTRVSVPVVEPGECIRATVIGASQFTVQVSGKTIYLPNPDVLPVHNIPVVHLGVLTPDEIDPDAIAAAFAHSADLLDLPRTAKLALAFAWTGEPDYERLLAMARGIMKFAAPDGRRSELLVLMIDGDVARGLGRIIEKELRLEGEIVSVDGVQLKELDFVDIGEFLDPPGVVPVVIKSLLFS